MPQGQINRQQQAAMLANVQQQQQPQQQQQQTQPQLQQKIYVQRQQLQSSSPLTIQTGQLTGHQGHHHHHHSGPHSQVSGKTQSLHNDRKTIVKYVL